MATKKKWKKPRTLQAIGIEVTCNRPLGTTDPQAMRDCLEVLVEVGLAQATRRRGMVDAPPEDTLVRLGHGQTPWAGGGVGFCSATGPNRV